MARDLPHLPLPQLQAPISRKKHGGGGNSTRANPAQHANDLISQAATVVQVAQRRAAPGAAPTPTLIFKLRLAPGTDLDENTLGRFGLSLIARDEAKTLVVFSSESDLRLFHERVREYGAPTGHIYAEVGNIDALEPISAKDRRGRRLDLDPVPADAGDIPVDVELWHPGTVAGARDRLDELREIVKQGGGRQPDHFIGTDLLLARCRVDAALVDQLLELDIVREVDRIPATAIERVQALGVGANDLPEIREAPPEAAAVLILDSGITPNHPLLAASIGDAQVFPDELGTRDGAGANDPNGHGTAVAAFAAWGSPHEAIKNDPMQAEVAVFSARVLDQHGEYDPNLLVERQLTDAIEYFLTAYPQCRVINLSLGDPRAVFAAGERQTRLAARIDELAHELQARNVLFTISTGNHFHDPDNHAEHISAYPGYLLEAGAGLIEPATAALALTVGGLSAGGHPLRNAGAPGRRAVAEIEGHPSPFTRTGPGVGAMIKPEFVEYAGDLVYDPAAPRKLGEDPGLGLPSAARDFAPPGGQLLRAVVGTSHAAPAVAHAAARLFNRYPDATPNLVRALLADSAQLPDRRPGPLQARHHATDVLRIYGYGRPSAERALDSANNDVLLITESSIALDSFQLFEIPFLPADFIAKQGTRCISVSLAFDPPTRQSRGDSYLGLSMQLHLFRNAEQATVAAAFRDWKAAPAGAAENELKLALSTIPGSHKIDLEPGSNLRGKGTLQRGLKTVGPAWGYDGGPLILAVSCLRKWAPPELSAQRYAVVVSLKHSDPSADLHAPLQARLQARTRVRL